VLKLNDRGFFFILYRKEMRGRPQLELRFPSIKSTPYLIIRGKKASRTYAILMQFIESRGLKEYEYKENGCVIIRVPVVSGLCITAYIILTYTTRVEERYIHILDKMIYGEFPLIRRFIDFITLAVELSEYIGQQGDPSAKRQLASPQALRLVSNIMRYLLAHLDGGCAKDRNVLISTRRCSQK